jgi:hypothetical protein
MHEGNKMNSYQKDEIYLELKVHNVESGDEISIEDTDPPGAIVTNRNKWNRLALGISAFSLLLLFSCNGIISPYPLLLATPNDSISCEYDWIKRSLMAAAWGPILIMAFYISLFFAGFTTAGITAASYASVWMAGIGNVAAGSFFSVLMSISALGIAVVSFGVYLFFSIGICVPIFLFWMYRNGCDVNGNCICHR